jgi:sarcosine oxidase subunit gamma
VAEPIARTPFDGLLQLRAGTVTASEVVHASITSVAPLKRRTQEVSDALEAALGIRLPPPGRLTGTDRARVVWTGMDQWFVLGTPPPALPGAAVTDQSDAWGCLALEGAGAPDVLARLVPVDVRPDAFGTGHAMRTLLGHMACVLMKTGDGRFEIMVYRSMARSVAQDLNRAMRMVAARGAS